MARTTGFYVTVFMNKRDVTPWVTNVVVSNRSKILWREFSLSFAGWDALEDDPSWDIFAGTDGSVDRQECIVRDGVSPPETPPTIQVKKDAGTVIQVTGYDHVWRITRRRPRTTLVLVSDPERVSVERALESYREGVGMSGYTGRSSSPGVTGRTSIIKNVRTMHQAVSRLANWAGVHVNIQIPNYPIQPVIVGPDQTYWQAIANLVAPFSPLTYFDRSRNLLWFYDSLSHSTGAARWTTLPVAMIDSMGATSMKNTRPGRILLRVNRWL